MPPRSPHSLLKLIFSFSSLFSLFPFFNFPSSLIFLIFPLFHEFPFPSLISTCICLLNFFKIIFGPRVFGYVTIIIIIFLHGLDRLTSSGIDALPSFPRASTISSSSAFVAEEVFRQSVVIHSLKVCICFLHLVFQRSPVLFLLFHSLRKFCFCSSQNTNFFFPPPMPPHVLLVDFVVLPPRHGRNVTDF